MNFGCSRALALKAGAEKDVHKSRQFIQPDHFMFLFDGATTRNKLMFMSQTIQRPSGFAQGKRRSPGFTLTELLVVITIIAVLTGISMTVIGRMKESAKQTGCLSNLRNIGVGVFLYASDHGDDMPSLVSGPVDKPWHSSIWQQDLDVYVPYPKSNPAGASGGDVPPLPGSVFVCPCAKKERGWWGTLPDYGATGRISNAAGTPGVFSMNAWGSFVQPLKRALIRQPERCMMVADACSGNSVQEGFWSMNVTPETLKSISAGVPASGLAPRHGYNGKDSRSGRFGVVFCDGHVEAFSYGDERLRNPAFVQALTVPF